MKSFAVASLLSGLAMVMADNSTSITFTSVSNATAANSTTAVSSITSVNSCSCGYQDASTGLRYTDAIIVYFNETSTLDPNVFETEDFAWHKQKGWNVIYRQGAASSNVQVAADSSNTTSLQMTLSGARFDHLSLGAQVRSMRQDIMYGTFRTSMKAAAPGVGGSAASMFLQFNDSVSLQMDVLNQNNPSEGRFMQRVNAEFPADSLGINFTYLVQNHTITNPWDFQNLRFDWAQESVNFYINSTNTRSVSIKDRSLPNVPQPLHFAHWSTGDDLYMEGPPENDSIAQVQYIRAFFNTSTMDSNAHAAYDVKCAAQTACSVDDYTLRGYTSYTNASTADYVPVQIGRELRVHAGIVAGVFATFGLIALINAFIRRTPWYKIVILFERKPKIATPKHSPRSSKSLRNSLRQSMGTASGYVTPGSIWSTAGTPLPPYSPLSRAGSARGVQSFPFPGTVEHNQIMAAVEKINNDEKIDHDEKRVEFDDSVNVSQGHKVKKSLSNRSSQGSSIEKGSLYNLKEEEDITDAKNPFEEITVVVAEEPMAVEPPLIVVEEKPAKKEKAPKIPLQMPGSQSKFVDYLAGLVGLCCIVVTFNHFALTFWPYVTMLSGDTIHFEADRAIATYIGPWIFAPLAIGPFFLTSARFLCQRYLRTGEMKDVGMKMLLRSPRMLFPVFVFVIFEYFLISLGVTESLEWLPSVSYSTWPYVQPQANAGAALNNMIEIAYLPPHSTPEIINHYCVGVLWTLPIQLQYSFLTLLFTVVIRDIKKPWKRFGFYAINIAAGWYAVSWSACYWLGLMLADAEVTYKWYGWVQAKKIRLYPILGTCILVALASPLIFLFNNNYHPYSFEGNERGIHPDVETGRPEITMVSDAWQAYPEYYEPSLIILIFSTALQLIVELSTWVQAVLRTRLCLWLHPHIMTIYLGHGLVFWSLGAWVCVSLAGTSIPYWANLIITAICCYIVIIVGAMILTPLLLTVTLAASKHVERWATKARVPHRDTTAPYGKQLLRRAHDEPQGPPSV